MHTRKKQIIEKQFHNFTNNCKSFVIIIHKEQYCRKFLESTDCIFTFSIKTSFKVHCFPVLTNLVMERWNFFW